MFGEGGGGERVGDDCWASRSLWWRVMGIQSAEVVYCSGAGTTEIPLFCHGGLVAGVVWRGYDCIRLCG